MFLSSTVLTFLISAVVITITMGCFVAWVRRKGPVPIGRANVRAIVALVAATLVLGSSMTLFGRYVGASSPLFAAMATMVTLGWTAFVYNVVPLRLPVSLRGIRVKVEIFANPFGIQIEDHSPGSAGLQPGISGD